MLRPVADLAAFAELQLASQDIDPIYPVLAWLERDMEPESALWLTLLYAAFYHLPSAFVAFACYPEPAMMDEAFLTLPTGVERRNLRGGKRMAMHLASLLQVRDSFGGFDPWLRFHLKEGPEKAKWNWDRIFWVIQGVWGNARWAGYKQCELLQKVHGFPLKAPNMGNDFSSGPRHGMALFRKDLPMGNSQRAIVLLDAFAEDLRTELRIFHEVKLEIEQLETVLCDFHAMADGRYYPGLDIDTLQEQLLASSRPDLMGPIWEAREAVLPIRYLGEDSGWGGRDKRRMKVYKNMGTILGR